MKFLDNLGIAIEVVLHEFGIGAGAVFGHVNAERF
jgi:hypothetical protein